MGRPQFENQTMISAVSSKQQKFVRKSVTTSLPAQTFEYHTIYSSPKTTGRVTNIEMFFRPLNNGTASPSWKSMFVENMYDSGSFGTPLFTMSAYPPDDLMLYYAQPANTSSYSPNDLNAFFSQITKGLFDDLNPIRVVFHNATGAATTAERKFTLFYEEEVTNR